MVPDFVLAISKSLSINALCGDGRTRTAVQTTYQIAFYMLILPLIVGMRLPEDGPLYPYPLNLGGATEKWPRASGFDDTPKS